MWITNHKSLIQTLLSLAQYFKLLEFWGLIRKYLKENSISMYLSRKFYAEWLTVRQSENAELPLALFSLFWKANLLTFEFVVQQLEFTLAVGKCWGFCWSIFMFYSICLCKNNAEAIKFLGLIKNTFPRIIKKRGLKKKFFG